MPFNLRHFVRGLLFWRRPVRHPFAGPEPRIRIVIYYVKYIYGVFWVLPWVLLAVWYVIWVQGCTHVSTREWVPGGCLNLDFLVEDGVGWVEGGYKVDELYRGLGKMQAGGLGYHDIGNISWGEEGVVETLRPSAYAENIMIGHLMVKDAAMAMGTQSVKLLETQPKGINLDFLETFGDHSLSPILRTHTFANTTIQMILPDML